MTRKKIKTGLILLICMTVVSCRGNNNLPAYTEPELRKAAAQMLIIGFRGSELTPDNPVCRDIVELGVGGVVLFDVDLCSKGGNGSRNITAKDQLTKLTGDLQALATVPLLITIDQEGGKVSRLKEEYGFPRTVTAQYLGKLNQADSTLAWSERTASILEETGVNTNFAPCTDVNVNPVCPVIGKRGRSFSADPDIVTTQAAAWIDGHHKHHILTALKHFPGHGSAATDSHKGFTDISATWSREELEPYRQLISQGKADIIMSAHVFNKNLDENYPATLSSKVLTGILRNELGYDGVISTDDLYMDAIAKHYDLKEALALTLNAGADMLILGNNSPDGYAENRPAHTVDLIVELVKEGKVPYSRIQEANGRIAALKDKLKQ